MAQGKNRPRRTILLVVILLIAVAILFGILFVKKHYQARQTQQIATTYSGNLPCADCSGIYETLTLIPSTKNPSMGTYVLHDVYQGKDMKPFISTGTWQISKGIPQDRQALLLTLNPNDPGMNTYFLIHDDESLEMLDNDKKKIDSPFDEILYRVKQ